VSYKRTQIDSKTIQEKKIQNQNEKTCKETEIIKKRIEILEEKKRDRVLTEEFPSML
jgi:hypothetical protein